MIPLIPSLKIGAVVAVVGLGWTAWHQRDGRLRAEGYAAAQDSIHQMQLDSMRAQIRRDSVEIARTDSVASVTIARADSARAEALRAAERANRRRPAIVERIVHAPDTTAIRAAVEELEATHETEVLSLQEAIAQADSVIAEKDRQIEARDRSLTMVRSALRAALEVRAANTQPGFLETWGGRALALGVGAGVGYLAAGR